MKGGNMDGHDHCRRRMVVPIGSLSVMIQKTGRILYYSHFTQTGREIFFGDKVKSPAGKGLLF